MKYWHAPHACNAHRDILAMGTQAIQAIFLTSSDLRNEVGVGVDQAASRPRVCVRM